MCQIIKKLKPAANGRTHVSYRKTPLVLKYQRQVPKIFTSLQIEVVYKYKWIGEDYSEVAKNSERSWSLSDECQRENFLG